MPQISVASLARQTGLVHGLSVGLNFNFSGRCTAHAASLELGSGLCPSLPRNTIAGPGKCRGLDCPRGNDWRGSEVTRIATVTVRGRCGKIPAGPRESISRTLGALQH